APVPSFTTPAIATCARATAGAHSAAAHTMTPTNTLRRMLPPGLYCAYRSCLSRIVKREVGVERLRADRPVGRRRKLGCLMALCGGAADASASVRTAARRSYLRLPENSLNGMRPSPIGSTVPRIEPSSCTAPLTVNGAGPVPTRSEVVKRNALPVHCKSEIGD